VDDGPIKAQTVITFERDSGKILDKWGSNLWVFSDHSLKTIQ
jgi:hypothetical protein